MIAGTANEKFISIDIDRTNSVFIAANVADPINIMSGASTGFGKPAPLA